jgi:hypothetical protein
MVSRRHFFVKSYLYSGYVDYGVQTTSARANVVRMNCVLANSVQMTSARACCYRMRSVKACRIWTTSSHGICLPDEKCQGIYLPDGECQGMSPPDDGYQGIYPLDDKCQGVYLPDAECQGIFLSDNECQGVYLQDMAHVVQTTSQGFFFFVYSYLYEAYLDYGGVYFLLFPHHCPRDGGSLQASRCHP